MNEIKSPLKAIRQNCIDCCCGHVAEVKQCTVTKCALYPFRMGKNPFRTTRVMTEEERQRAVERLAVARNKKDDVG